MILKNCHASRLNYLIKGDINLEEYVKFSDLSI